jgi:hypothetical protein
MLLLFAKRYHLAIVLKDNVTQKICRLSHSAELIYRTLSCFCGQGVYDRNCEVSLKVLRSVIPCVTTRINILLVIQSTTNIKSV